MRGPSQIVIGAAFLLAASAAQAAPLTWTISGVFEDGSQISGSFAYDADTNAYSAIDIVTESFGPFGYAYGQMPLMPGSGVTGNQDQLQLVSGFGDDQLFLLFGAPLTSAGGVIGVSGFEELFGAQSGQRNTAVASVSAPAPPAVPLLGIMGRLGLVCIALVLGIRFAARAGRAHGLGINPDR